MNKKLVALVLVILAGTVPNGAASAPQEVLIVHHATPASGVFTATGAINDEGDVTRDAALFAASPSPTVGAGQFVYTFHGHNGDLTVRLEWLLTATEIPWIGHVDGHWVVSDGTGDYDGLHGQGRYVATINFQTMERDAIFAGKLH